MKGILFLLVVNFTVATSSCSHDDLPIDNSIPASLKNGLIGLYTFSGGPTDSSISGNHGTVNGAILSTDRFGNLNSAYQFNGLTNTFQAPLNATSYSISMWYYTVSLTNQFNTLYTYNSSYAELTNNGTVYSRFQYPSPTSLSGITNFIAPFNQWNHIVVIYQSTSNLLDTYINGTNHFSSVPVSDGTYNPAFINNVIYLGGTKLNNTNFFKGKLDDVRIYNRSLTQTEIMYLATH